MASEARLRLPLTLRACALCALGLALLSAGCEKKPTRTTPQVLVPSIEREPQQAPNAAVPLVPPVPGPEFGPPPPPPQPPVETSKPNKHRKPARKPEKPASAEAPKGEPAKPEVSRQEKPAAEASPANGGGASPAQITAAVPAAAAQSQTQNTEQLLHSSEAKLASLGRSLNASEKAMVQQARSYIDQSSDAMRSGDIERAYNLAMKANLLANELSK